MIYKRCSMCRKRIPTGTSCPDCRREYRKPEGVYKLYHTQRWRDLRAAVMARYDGMDQWALHIHGRIAYAETVHHIVPSSDDEGQFFVYGNLVPVSRASHDEIHALYKTDKAGTQQILRKIIRGRGGGDAKSSRHFPKTAAPAFFAQNSK